MSDDGEPLYGRNLDVAGERPYIAGPVTRTFMASIWRTSVIAVLFLLLGSFCVAQDLPRGWHSPSNKLTAQDFRRRDHNHFLTAIGDFNGDGVQDKALLLVNEKKFGLFVCLTTTQGCDWHRLEEVDLGWLKAMGIATVKPGRYKTACGKGYWACEKNEPALLVLKNDAIEFFKDESASSYYVYNQKKKDFVPVAISD